MSRLLRIYFCVVWIPLGLGLGARRDANAQDLANLIANAQFAAPSARDIGERRAHCHRSALQLQQKLGFTDNGVAWQQFLKLPELLEALTNSQATDQAESTDQHGLRKAVSATRARLIGGHKGLEIDELTSLRTALAEYAVAYDLSQSEDALAEFNRQIEELKKLLPSLATGATTIDDYRRMAPIVSWLEQRQQTPALVSLIKSRFNQPNVVITIDDSTVQQLTIQDVHEVESVNEVQDGRHITGQAVATGKAFVVPVSGSYANELQVVFNGTIQTTLNGSQGPVSFQLLGNTALTARRPVLLSRDGFQSLSSVPAACTVLSTQAVCTRRNGVGSKLIRKIAKNMIDKERPEAQADLNVEATQGFLTEFEKEIDLEIASAESDFREDLIAPLVRMDLDPEQLDFRTSASNLKIQMKIDGGYGLAATAPLPESSVEDDIRVAVHESVIDRVADRMLAGEEISDFTKLADDLGFSLSEEDLAQMPDDIGITFADQQPVTAEFEGDMLTITIRGKRFRLGRNLLVAMKAVIRYHVAAEGGRLRLTLAGEPEVLPPDRGGRSGRFFAQKNVLKRRLQKDLPAEQILEPFDLPEPADGLGMIQFVNSTLQKGWLQISLKGSGSTTPSFALND